MVVALLVCAGVAMGALFKWLYDRHATRQLARMTSVEATWNETHAQTTNAVTTESELPYRSAADGAQPAAPRERTADEELLRLAAEGERRAHDQSARQRSENNLRRERVRLHRLCDAMKSLPDAPPSTVVETVPAEVEFPPAAFDPGDWMSLEPLPRGDVEAAARKANRESAWLASLPFVVERYFAILAENPDRGFANDTYCIAITIELADPANAPPRELLDGVMHVHDPSAAVMSLHPLTLQSGGIACWSSAGYSNASIAPYVHGLVDKVLLPLHRSRAITRVSLECV